jgi:imidazole glycerol-phosphate synthase subunit HisH
VIAIIDYEAGNLRSIRRALEKVGADTLVTADPDAVRSADAVVLPGVGHAGHAIQQLEKTGMAEAIRDSIDAGKPFLGICVGMQILFEHQEEGDVDGLAVLRGRVRQIGGVAKLPHIGWNQSYEKSEPSADESLAPYYYFVHSYLAAPEDAADVVETTWYGEEFPTVVRHGNVWGTQFHPEKSRDAGQSFLRRWLHESGLEVDHRE